MLENCLIFCVLAKALKILISLWLCRQQCTFLTNILIDNQKSLLWPIQLRYVPQSPDLFIKLCEFESEKRILYVSISYSFFLKNRKILKKGSNTELGRAPTMFSACYHLINDFMAIMSEIILGIKTPLFSPGTEHKVRCWFPLHILAES